MRSVVAVLHDASESGVSEFLDATFPGQREPWLLHVDGDPCLYIRVRPYDAGEYEPGHAVEFARRCGAPPTVEVTADVSGRHAGATEVARFVSAVLTRFGGVALDDFTDHMWTLSELQCGAAVQGHPFFDYPARHEGRGRSA